jgi:hypothetical protein
LNFGRLLITGSYLFQILFDIYLNYVLIILFFYIMMSNIILQIGQPLFKSKSRTTTRSQSGSGSTTRSAYFLLEAEAPETEAEALRVEAEVEALKI